MKWFLGVIMLSSIVCFDGFCLMHVKFDKLYSFYCIIFTFVVLELGNEYVQVGY